MEGKYLFTKSMVKVLQPLVEQLELFSSCCRAGHFDNIPQSSVEDICYPLLQLKDVEFKREVLSLKVALRDFYNSVDLIKLREKENHEEIFKNMLRCAYSVLEAKDKREVQSISNLIENCDLCFMKFVDTESENELIHYLQVFLENTRLCLQQIGIRSRDLLSIKQQQQILLCINQISKSVALLTSAFQNRRNPFDKDKLLNNYVTGRIKLCFLELKSTIGHPELSFKDDKGCGGQFVQKMDVALNVISSCNEGVFQMELKSAIDEVLCQAMSIAHVALNPDISNISNSCQKVLKALEELRKYYCLEENTSLKKLYIVCLTNSLELLEQQVNTALLKLVLEVFSDLFTPLKKLLCICHKNNAKKLNSLDLDEMVSIFDLQMDRIMQIGLFAITCSDDIRSIVSIKSCLASLESLEPELIPALLAHYQDPSGYANLKYLKELMNHWKSEVKELKELIHNIVDPAAFCEVTVGDVQYLVTTVKAKLQDNNISSLRCQMSAILKKAALLAQQLKISFRDESMNRFSAEVQQHIHDLCFSCNELDAAYHLYLHDTVESIHHDHKLRLLKRCELVLSLMKKIQPFILEILNFSGKEAHNTGLKTSLFHKHGSLLHFADTVRDLPIDIDESKQESSGSKNIQSTFENIARQGMVIMKERSVLYHTPKKNKKVCSNLQCYQLLNLTKLDTTINQHDFMVEKTLGLDITAILDKLTFLSDTLTSKTNQSNCPEELITCDLLQMFCNSSTERTSDILPSIAEVKISNLHCLTKSQVSSTGTLNTQFTSSEIDTPQRINDLCAVQKKIAAIQAYLD